MLNAPTVWLFDMMVQMYGALFLMAGPYALAQDTHVRADVALPAGAGAQMAGAHRFHSLPVLFFFPGMLALFWFGWEIAADSWRYQEVSWNSPARIQIYFFKTLIPLAGALLILQGIAEILRCWRAMRSARLAPAAGGRAGDRGGARRGDAAAASDDDT